MIILPYGNIYVANAKMRWDAKKLGNYIKKTRKELGITQQELAFISGTGLRFIIDLENGKPTCQLEKTLIVIGNLGIKITLTSAGNNLEKL